MSNYCVAGSKPTEFSESWIKFVFDRFHDILPGCFILAALFAPPKYLTLYPVILLILNLDWADSDGQCFLTKLSRHIDGKPPLTPEAWNYTKESVQHSDQWTNPLYLFFGGDPVDHRDSVIKANKSTFTSLMIMSITGFIAWNRVVSYYKLPSLFTSKLRYVVMIYFLAWIATNIMI